MQNAIGCRGVSYEAARQGVPGLVSVSFGMRVDLMVCCVSTCYSTLWHVRTRYCILKSCHLCYGELWRVSVSRTVLRYLHVHYYLFTYCRTPWLLPTLGNYR